MAQTSALSSVTALLAGPGWHVTAVSACYNCCMQSSVQWCLGRVLIVTSASSPHECVYALLLNNIHVQCSNLIVCYANTSNPSQRCAVLCVLMEALVWPLSSAPVSTGGLGAAVTFVSTCLHSMLSPCGESMTSPSPSPPPAVCHPNCGNGGTCVGPNNCSCPPGWTGGTCSQGVGYLLDV